MKNLHLYIIIFFALLISVGCKKLDRFPLDSPSSETFYSNKIELDLAVNALYNSALYQQDLEEWSDNYWNRTTIGNEIIHSNATIQTATFSTTWSNSYKAIARANGILDNINRAQDITAAYRKQVEGQARFARAYAYSILTLHFGDVPLIKTTISLEESYSIKRTPAAELKSFIYSEFDFAASVLPVTYPSGFQYFTKGIVLSMKARYAISINDWQNAADAAKQVMDLKVYGLYSSYRNLFLRAGQHSSEVIWSFPRSATYAVTYGIQSTLPRMVTGFASNIPTIELIDSYECTDGKTIDKSPLYDFKKPFLNRDPRLKATIVTPGENFLGYVFENHPDSTLIFSTKDNKKVANKDNKNAANPFGSFTGYLWKKTIDDSQLVNINKVDLDLMIIRYAEILLIYAEAKAELNQIDQSVLDAVNLVRARGYGVAATAVATYPAVTTTIQTDLRKIIRRERRIEFAFEGRRYADLLRWKLVSTVFGKTMYGSPINKANYPFAGVPVFDANEIPSYEAYASLLTVIDKRNFDEKYMLWPVPYNELALNKGLGQNPGW